MSYSKHYQNLVDMTKLMSKIYRGKLNGGDFNPGNKVTQESADRILNQITDKMFMSVNWMLKYSTFEGFYGLEPLLHLLITSKNKSNRLDTETYTKLIQELTKRHDYNIEDQNSEGYSMLVYGIMFYSGSRLDCYQEFLKLTGGKDVATKLLKSGNLDDITEYIDFTDFKSIDSKMKKSYPKLFKSLENLNSLSKVKYEDRDLLYAAEEVTPELLGGVPFLPEIAYPIKYDKGYFDIIYSAVKDKKGFFGLELILSSILMRDDKPFLNTDELIKLMWDQCYWVNNSQDNIIKVIKEVINDLTHYEDPKLYKDILNKWNDLRSKSDLKLPPLVDWKSEFEDKLNYVLNDFIESYHEDIKMYLSQIFPGFTPKDEVPVSKDLKLFSNLDWWELDRDQGISVNYPEEVVDKVKSILGRDAVYCNYGNDKFLSHNFNRLVRKRLLSGDIRDEGFTRVYQLWDTNLGDALIYFPGNKNYTIFIPYDKKVGRDRSKVFSSKSKLGDLELGYLFEYNGVEYEVAEDRDKKDFLCLNRKSFKFESLPANTEVTPIKIVSSYYAVKDNKGSTHLDDTGLVNIYKYYLDNKDKNLVIELQHEDVVKSFSNKVTKTIVFTNQSEVDQYLKSNPDAKIHRFGDKLFTYYESSIGMGNSEDEEVKEFYEDWLEYSPATSAMSHRHSWSYTSSGFEQAMEDLESLRDRRGWMWDKVKENFSASELSEVREQALIYIDWLESTDNVNDSIDVVKRISDFMLENLDRNHQMKYFSVDMFQLELEILKVINYYEGYEGSDYKSLADKMYRDLLSIHDSDKYFSSNVTNKIIKDQSYNNSRKYNNYMRKLGNYPRNKRFSRLNPFNQLDKLETFVWLEHEITSKSVTKKKSLSLFKSSDQPEDLLFIANASDSEASNISGLVTEGYHSGKHWFDALADETKALSTNRRYSSHKLIQELRNEASKARDIEYYVESVSSGNSKLDPSKPRRTHQGYTNSLFSDKSSISKKLIELRQGEKFIHENKVFTMNSISNNKAFVKLFSDKGVIYLEPDSGEKDELTLTIGMMGVISIEGNSESEVRNIAETISKNSGMYATPNSSVDMEDSNYKYGYGLTHWKSSYNRYGEKPSGNWEVAKEWCISEAEKYGYELDEDDDYYFSDLNMEVKVYSSKVGLAGGSNVAPNIHTTSRFTSSNKLFSDDYNSCWVVYHDGSNWITKKIKTPNLTSFIKSLDTSKSKSIAVCYNSYDLSEIKDSLKKYDNPSEGIDYDTTSFGGIEVINPTYDYSKVIFSTPTPYLVSSYGDYGPFTYIRFVSNSQTLYHLGIDEYALNLATADESRLIEYHSKASRRNVITKNYKDWVSDLYDSTGLENLAEAIGKEVIELDLSVEAIKYAKSEGLQGCIYLTNRGFIKDESTEAYLNAIRDKAKFATFTSKSVKDVNLPRLIKRITKSTLKKVLDNLEVKLYKNKSDYKLYTNLCQIESYYDYVTDVTSIDDIPEEVINSKSNFRGSFTRFVLDYKGNDFLKYVLEEYESFNIKTLMVSDDLELKKIRSISELKNTASSSSMFVIHCDSSFSEYIYGGVAITDFSEYNPTLAVYYTNGYSSKLVPVYFNNQPLSSFGNVEITTIQEFKLKDDKKKEWLVDWLKGKISNNSLAEVRSYLS